MGNEDLMAVLDAGRSLLLWEAANGGQDVLAGALLNFAEARPLSLPAAAPDRLFVRGVAFRRHFSPTTGMQKLLAAGLHLSRSQPELLIAYGGENWLNRAYLGAGMTLAEQVHFYELADLQRQHWERLPATDTVSVSAASPADLAPLASMDSLAFEPLWHCSARELGELLLRGPLLIARINATMAGYLSLLLERGVATIARLAVHPQYQGQGIGKRLLIEGLCIAQENGFASALLNTQATNTRSQRLYRSLGFRPTGRHFPVYTHYLP